jgi:cyclic pyranopterin phosphate synthase
MPENGVPWIPTEQQLTPEELRSVVKTAALLGMRKIRFTGGEPLLRKDLESLIEVARDSGFEDISLTTNGFGLIHRANLLRQAGLNRLNISLDTLRPERFRAIARGGQLQSVLDGIDAALDADLQPVKINIVALKGKNDDEAVEFARWTLTAPLHVRFIEVMPIRWNLDFHTTIVGFTNSSGDSLLRFNPIQSNSINGGVLSDLEMRRSYISSGETRQSIESALGPLQDASLRTNGPARTYRLPTALGTIGFISQISNDMCSRCNRLRLTSDGFLRPCLMSDGEMDLKPALRTGGDIAELFRLVVAGKPERHYLAEGQQVQGRNMSQMGG